MRSVLRDGETDKAYSDEFCIGDNDKIFRIKGIDADLDTDTDIDNDILVIQ